MLKIIISGINGRLGSVIHRVADDREDIQVVAGVDISDNGENTVPVFANFQELAVKGDVIIDASHPSALAGLLDYAVKNGVPAVLAATGYSEEQEAMVDEAARTIPILNMSIGVNLLAQLATACAKVLGNDFDIEIVEAHHNQKLDAPSGTAKMLAKAVEAGLDFTPEYVYERESKRQKRDHKEISMNGRANARSATIRRLACTPFAAARLSANTRLFSPVGMRLSPSAIPPVPKKFSPSVRSTQQNSLPIKTRAGMPCPI